MGRGGCAGQAGVWPVRVGGTWGMGGQGIPVTISAPTRRTQTWRPSAKQSWPKSSNRTGASRRKWGRHFGSRKQGTLADGHILLDLSPKSQPRPRLRTEL